MDSYHKFLRSKEVSNMPCGFQIDKRTLPDRMYPYQSDITEWCCKRGKAALFGMTGVGKTLMQCAFADQVQSHTAGDVLIVAPLAVARQTVAEAAKFGIHVNYVRHADDVKRGISITNYEMLDKFEGIQWAGMVPDECFPPETPIDVLSIDSVSTCRYIRDVRPGDKILNAQGVDIVQDIYKRRINRAVKIGAGGHRITSSENHPFFTVHGWRSAQDLRPGDYVMATETAVRMVRDGILPEVCSIEDGKVLREILLSEMAHEHGGTQGQSSYAGSGCEEGRIEICMVEIGRPEGEGTDGQDRQTEPDGQPGNAGESFIPLAGNEAQTFSAWGKWSPNDIAAAIDEGCTVRRLDTGICYIIGSTSTRFSVLLQSRLRESIHEDSNRSGWKQSPCEEGTGRQEGCKAGFFRVDSVEILEQGHPELEQYRNADGHVYFYDIKATRHPSFSIKGMLVHNSSILKNFSGKTRNYIIDYAKDIPFKLPCTATPSPNDFMEIGNHSEFLGVMSYTEMLATFFVHDGGETAKWRLKGHAEESFWKWLASWAVFITKPSDLGYSDDGFQLPALNTVQHIVPSEAPEGSLFAFEVKGLQERQGARRESMQRRIDLCVEIVLAGL